MKSHKLSLSSIDAHELLKELSKTKQSAVFTGTIQGSSMLPWIKEGDRIEIVPVASAIRYGDVVAFFDKSHSRLVAHRVIGKKKDYVITKGDNCFRADIPIKKNNLAGIVTEITRGSLSKQFSIGNKKLFIACFSFVNLLQIFTKNSRILINIFKNKKYFI